MVHTKPDIEARQSVPQPATVLSDGAGGAVIASLLILLLLLLLLLV